MISELIYLSFYFMLEYRRQRLHILYLVLLFRVITLFLISFSYMVKKSRCSFKKTNSFLLVLTCSLLFFFSPQDFTFCISPDFSLCCFPQNYFLSPFFNLHNQRKKNKSFTPSFNVRLTSIVY